MHLDKKDANRKNRDFLGFSSFFTVYHAVFTANIEKIRKYDIINPRKAVEI